LLIACYPDIYIRSKNYADVLQAFDHKHSGAHEENYIFTTVEKLVADFLSDVAKKRDNLLAPSFPRSRESSKTNAREAGKILALPRYAGNF